MCKMRKCCYCLPLRAGGITGVVMSVGMITVVCFIALLSIIKVATDVSEGSKLQIYIYIVLSTIIFLTLAVATFCLLMGVVMNEYYPLVRIWLIFSMICAVVVTLWPIAVTSEKETKSEFDKTMDKFLSVVVVLWMAIFIYIWVSVLNYYWLLKATKLRIAFESTV